MLKITRYINGNKIADKDFRRYEVKNDVILKIIKAVKERLHVDFQQKADFRQDTLVEMKL